MQKNIISTTWLFIWGNGDIVNQARWIYIYNVHVWLYKARFFIKPQGCYFFLFFFCNKPFHAQLCSFYDSQFNKFI